MLPGPDQSAGGRAFYHFHPDETTLVQAALNPIDPFAPELTSYGTLPVYLLRGVLELNRIVLGRDFKNQESPHDVRYVYITARILAVLVSCLTLYLVWVMGMRWFGELTGLLAVSIVAVAPLAIQLAHFYTVDGQFTLLVLAAVHAILNALEKDDRRWFVWAGVLIGLSGAVRLIGLDGGARAAGRPSDPPATLEGSPGPQALDGWPCRVAGPARAPAVSRYGLGADFPGTIGPFDLGWCR